MINALVECPSPIPALSLTTFLIKLAFISGWKNILKIKDQENIFDQVENKMNKSARKKGGLTLTIPGVTIDCIKV